jgi:phospholipase/lecithinase/hemolysin
MPHKLGTVAVLLGLMVDVSAYGQKKADFSRFVVAGDSLSAGYQNGQLIQTSQVHGYANVIASQAGLSLNLPLLPAPGYPQITIEQNYAVTTGLTPVPRLNNQQTWDVAVPGFSVATLIGLPAACPPDYTNPIDVMAVEILNPACSINPAPTHLQEAAGLKPTPSILWIGSNDVLFSLLYGTAATNPFTFASYYHIAISTMAQASGHLVVANIPDVTLTPYLSSIPTLAGIVNLPVPVVEAAFGLKPGDMVTPYAFPIIEAMGTSLTPLPNSSAQGPVVIRAATVAQIRLDVIAYNIDIAIEAAAHGATLVDIYSLVNNLAANGVEVGGQRLTTAFLGGLFSLDGIHPTNTGYAIIANQFITTMNRSIAAGIPPISIEQVSKTDPLLPADKHGKQKEHVSVGMADCLRSLGKPY